MMKILFGFILGIVVSHLALAWSAGDMTEEKNAAWKSAIEEVEKDVPDIWEMENFGLMRMFFNTGYSAGALDCTKYYTRKK